jgi:hypothetical protein
MLMPLRCCAALLVLGIYTCAQAQDIENLGRVEFQGKVAKGSDLSALAMTSDGYLVIGSDEGTSVQVLRKIDAATYAVLESIPLANPLTDQEIDIEGIAIVGRTVHVLGSHARKRKKLDPSDETQAENRRRMTENIHEPLRESLYRFELNADGKLASEVQVTTLRPRIESDLILRPFLEIPGKEGGIDLEALMARDAKLWAGFRGPVLRDGYAPVLVFDFANPARGELRFVQLGGLGIRDMASTRDGILLLAGPIGNARARIEIYLWDGQDQIPGSDVNITPVKKLGELAPPHEAHQANAEGLLVLEETDDAWEILVVFDGAKKGMPTRYRVAK